MTEAKETNFRVVKYSNEHIHVVEIDEETGAVWTDTCHLSRNWNRCTAPDLSKLTIKDFDSDDMPESADDFKYYDGNDWVCVAPSEFEETEPEQILLTTTKTYARLEGLFKSLNQGSRLSIDEQWSMNTDTHGNPENWNISGFAAENVWWSEENTYSVYEALCEALDHEVNGNDEWSKSCDRAATLAQLVK